MIPYTLHGENGELVGITCNVTIIRLLVETGGYDLRNEGQKVTLADRKAWRDDKFRERLPGLKPNKHGRVTKAMKDQLRKQVNQSPDQPKVGTFRSLQESPQLATWLVINGHFLTPEKRRLLMKRLWQVLTGANKGTRAVRGRGNRDTFIRVLAVMLSTPDPKAFVDVLFNISVLDATKMGPIPIPAALMPLLDICTKVDGRGEVLAAFMFNDVAWLPGNGRHDLQGEDSVGMWHVKEIVSGSIRMGSNSYSRSNVCSTLSTMQLQKPGRTDPRYGLSDELIAANQPALDEKFAHAGGFMAALNVDLQAAESGTQGTMFFKNGMVIVRKMKDVECVGATKGDFVVRPRMSVSKNAANVAA